MMGRQRRKNQIINMPCIADIQIMGVLNVTPDSFSDGGQFNTLETALSQAHKLIADGADILDIGGESTRPFSEPVSAEVELQRVIPIIKAIRQSHTLPISIDTSKARVAEQALAAGADMINDVTALQNDPDMLRVAKEVDVPAIIMHMQGTPSDMQIKPSYDNVIEEISAFFKERIAYMTAGGVAQNRIIIDPGIGFGKTFEHNLTILKHLDKLKELDVPVMLAHSRKRFLGEITGIPAEKDRDLATAVVAALCAAQGISMVRVHDVAATRQALQLANAIDKAA